MRLPKWFWFVVAAIAAMCVVMAVDLSFGVTGITASILAGIAKFFIRAQSAS